MNFFFRLDFSNYIGFGHLIRCINFAEKIKQLNNKNKIFFIATKFDKSLKIKQIEESSFINFFYLDKIGIENKFDFIKDIYLTSQILKKYKVDWLIIDHYRIDFRWEKKIQTLVGKILVIDDLQDRKHFCNILLDYSIFRTNRSYKNQLNNIAKKLIGINYFLYNSKMIFYRKKSYENQRNVNFKKCIINLGGGDFQENTFKILNIIIVNNFLNYCHFYIVTGFNQNLYLKIKKLFLKKEYKKFSYELIKNSNSILRYYSLSDFAIGAGGVSSYERMFMGLPTIQLPIFRNQKKNTNFFYNSNLVIPLKKINKNEIKKSITKLKKNKFKIFKLSYPSFNHSSYDNIFHNMEISRANTNLINIRSVNKIDIKFLYSLQKIKDIRKFSYNNSTIKYSHHKKWFLEMFKNNNHLMFIIEYDNIKCGYIGLRYIKKKNYNVSILINPKFQNIGIATKVLETIVDLMKDSILIANVHKKKCAIL